METELHSKLAYLRLLAKKYTDCDSSEKRAFLVRVDDEFKTKHYALRTIAIEECDNIFGYNVEAMELFGMDIIKTVVAIAEKKEGVKEERTQEVKKSVNIGSAPIETRNDIAKVNKALAMSSRPKSVQLVTPEETHVMLSEMADSDCEGPDDILINDDTEPEIPKLTLKHRSMPLAVITDDIEESKVLPIKMPPAPNPRPQVKPASGDTSVDDIKPRRITANVIRPKPSSASASSIINAMN